MLPQASHTYAYASESTIQLGCPYWRIEIVIAKLVTANKKYNKYNK